MKDKLLIFFKGMAMGAADVVPGVSGGTIALISGIYQELLDSIGSVNLETFKLLFSGKFKDFWKQINGVFLLPLFLGIGVSIVLLASKITYLLSNYPILVWAFFFGLIIASVLFIAKQIKQWNALNIIGLVVGAIVAYTITVLVPAQIPDGLIYIFFAGCIAICAMILPGISGSFILLLMGAYATVIGAISGTIDGLKAVDMNLIVENGKKLAVFAVGCLVGLLSFSRLLSWMFEKAHNLILAVLTGFMIGSLNKVYPWKITTQFRMNSHGEEVPFLQNNVLPHLYTDGEPQIALAIVMAILGFLVVFGLEKLGNNNKEELK
ncbi:MAG: putative membrane protein [Arenicella sp.]|jgi:putative membrane protein